MLQQKIDNILKKSSIILIGVFNARVVTNHTKSMPEVVGKYSLGETNERSPRLLQFCSVNKYVFTNTIYKHKPNRRFTWIPPDRKTKSQIDFIITSQDNKKIIKNSHPYQSADVGSDYSLVMANVQLKRKFPKRSRMKGKQYDVGKLINDQKLAESFKMTIAGAFAPLMAFEDQEINQLYERFKIKNNGITESIAGIKRNPKTEGLGKEVQNLCKQRRNATLVHIKDPNNFNTRETYKSLHKVVKQEIKNFKKKKLEQKIQATEQDFHKNNSYNLLETLKEPQKRPYIQSLTNRVRNK